VKNLKGLFRGLLAREVIMKIAFVNSNECNLFLLTKFGMYKYLK